MAASSRTSALSVPVSCFLIKPTFRVQLRTVTLSADKVLNKEQATVKLAAWMKLYEDTIGITEVKQAQNHCIITEKKLVEAQEARREVQLQIQQVSAKLREVHAELDRVRRGDDRYLALVTREHAVLSEERQLHEQFQVHEKAERQYFSALSNAMRESHERQRAYAEKTKYWSIIGSACGAVIGIVGTSINNWIRVRELRDIVRQSAGGGAAGVVPAELEAAVRENREQMTALVASVTNHTRAEANGSSEADRRLEVDTLRALHSLESANERLSESVEEIKSVVVAKKLVSEDLVESAAAAGSGTTPGGVAVVYLGRDVEKMVKDAQHNLEWKIKVSSISTVAMIYAGVAVTIPILYKIFGG